MSFIHPKTSKVKIHYHGILVVSSRGLDGHQSVVYVVGSETVK